MIIWALLCHGASSATGLLEAVVFYLPCNRRFFVRTQAKQIYSRRLTRMNEVLRQEKKYAVNAADGVKLRGRLSAVMHGDQHNGAQG